MTRKIFHLTFVTLIAVFATLGIDIYLPAMPVIAEYFDVSPEATQLSISNFILGMCLGIFLFGPLSEAYSKPKLLFLCLFILSATNLLIAVCAQFSLFLFLRFINGFVAGGVFVLIRAIIPDIWSEEEVAGVMSLVMGLGWIGPVVAPLLGSHLLAINGWPLIFTFLALIGLALGIVSYWLFSRVEVKERSKASIIHTFIKSYLYVLKSKRDVLLIMLSAFLSAAYFAFLTGSSFIFISHFGFSENDFALIFALISICMALTGFLNKYLLDYYDISKIIGFNVTLGVILAVVMSVLSVSGSPHVLVFIPLSILILSLQLPPQSNSAALIITGTTDTGPAISSLLVASFGMGAIGALSVSLSKTIFLTNVLHSTTVTILFFTSCALLCYLLYTR